MNLLIEPWREFPADAFWTVATGFGVAAACGLLGIFVVLRRLALIGDALSHSVLPGLVLAFLLVGSRSTGPLFVGGLAAGLATVGLVEWLRHRGGVRPDAALGIVFSGLFALGVVLVQVFAAHVDLDADCILHGEIAFVPLAEPMVLFGLELGPLPAVRMLLVLAAVAILVTVFYKELLLTSFDEALAASLGFHPGVFRWALSAVLAVVIVSSFEMVGAILVVAMIVFPGATALLLCQRMPGVIAWTIVLSAIYALGGYHLGMALDASIAGAMTTVALALFILVWLLGPTHGILIQANRRRLGAIRRGSDRFLDEPDQPVISAFHRDQSPPR